MTRCNVLVIGSGPAGQQAALAAAQAGARTAIVELDIASAARSRRRAA